MQILRWLCVTRERISSFRTRNPVRAIIGANFIVLALGTAGCSTYSWSSLNPWSTSPKTEPVNRYGAIAYSFSSQHWHIRRNVADPARAATLAAQNCGARDCRIILNFGPGECGTFSLGDSGAVTVGTGPTERSAYDAALAKCKSSGQSCKVAPVQCNS